MDFTLCLVIVFSFALGYFLDPNVKKKNALEKALEEALEKIDQHAEKKLKKVDIFTNKKIDKIGNTVEKCIESIQTSISEYSVTIQTRVKELEKEMDMFQRLLREGGIEKEAELAAQRLRNERPSGSSLPDYQSFVNENFIPHPSEEN